MFQSIRFLEACEELVVNQFQDKGPFRVPDILPACLPTGLKRRSQLLFLIPAQLRQISPNIALTTLIPFLKWKRIAWLAFPCLLWHSACEAFQNLWHLDDRHCCLAAAKVRRICCKPCSTWIRPGMGLSGFVLKLGLGLPKIVLPLTNLRRVPAEQTHSCIEILPSCTWLLIK